MISSLNLCSFSDNILISLIKKSMFLFSAKVVKSKLSNIAFHSRGLPILFLYLYLSEMELKSSIKSSLKISKDVLSPKLTNDIFFFAIKTMIKSLYSYVY